MPYELRILTTMPLPITMTMLTMKSSAILIVLSSDRLVKQANDAFGLG